MKRLEDYGEIGCDKESLKVTLYVNYLLCSFYMHTYTYLYIQGYLLTTITEAMITFVTKENIHDMINDLS